MALLTWLIVLVREEEFRIELKAGCGEDYECIVGEANACHYRYALHVPETIEERVSVSRVST